MTTYAIGDVQGNYEALIRLLDKIQFNKQQDTLWFTGNLVNRDNDSLAVLRFVRDLGSRAVSVLGEEELRLLAFAEGVRTPEDNTVFDDVLSAPDRDVMLKWIRQLPFLHHESNFTLVHAGIPAEWSLSQAQTLAMEAEASLSMGNHKSFLENIFGDDPTRWHAKHRGWKRVRFIVNAFTRMRYCNDTGRLDFSSHGSNHNSDHNSEKTAGKNLMPWYCLPDRAMAQQNIIFGHWPAPDSETTPGIFALDTDSEQLTALALSSTSATPEKISVACA
ncbi:MAG: symmetrical bis(5'-nucleosyl)-tetraphosphatase [Gammaproteobacteria bacterium]|nr:symmetrical bis(5'-nucleosyl)-tetraphosphatase [Gammaproteobacteria bacterium]